MRHIRTNDLKDNDYDEEMIDNLIFIINGNCNELPQNVRDAIAEHLEGCDIDSAKEWLEVASECLMGALESWTIQDYDEWLDDN